MAEIALSGVVKRFGNHTVIHPLDLAIAHDEFVVLVGPSGCGKSTILRMIAGLEDVTEGEISIGGRVVNRVAPKDRNIAMVFQNYALYPHMTVARNLAFALRAARLPKPDIARRVAEVARILELSELLERRPGELSGGQRQRVAMGRAMVRNPAAFLFDEPLSNLDAKLRAAMRTEIKKLHRTVRTTIVFVTHDQVEAMTLADRIVILRDGRVEQIGTPLDVFHAPANVFVAGFIGSPAMNLIEAKVTAGEGGFTAAWSDGPALPLRRSGLADGQRVVLGIRPENLLVAAEGDLPGQVQVAEPLGTETLVVTRFGGRELMAKCDGRLIPPAGAMLRFALDLEHLHVFDAVSGLALRD